MRWYALISLMSDGRIKFLIWFVVAAVILAGILTLIEIGLKKKKRKQDVRIVDESVVEKMQRFLKYDKTPREKLDFVDKAAKEYFKETYETSLNSSYSLLIEELEKHRFTHKGVLFKKGDSGEILFLPDSDEIAFCKAMFATYYSREELSNDKVIALGKMLIDIKKDRKKAEEISHTPSFKEEIGGFSHKIGKIISGEIQEYAERKHIKQVRQQRIAKRNYELKIIRERERLAHKRRVAIIRAQKFRDAKKAIRKFFHEISLTISKKIQEREEKVYAEKLRQQRIAKRNYELKIIREKAWREYKRRVAAARVQKFRDAKKAIRKFFHEISLTISKKIQEREERKHIRQVRRQRIAKRNYELKIIRERVRITHRQRIAAARVQKIKKAKKVIKRLTFGWIKNLTKFGINQVRKVKYTITVTGKRKKMILAEEKSAVIKVQKIEKMKKELVKKNIQNWKDKILAKIENIRKKIKGVLFRKSVENIDYKEFYGDKNLQSGDSGEFRDDIEMRREGIAERIVRNEKNRLNQAGIFAA